VARSSGVSMLTERSLDFGKSPSTRSSMRRSNGEDAARRPCGAQRLFLRSTASTARSISAKQYTYEMNWKRDIDPKTGRPPTATPIPTSALQRGHPRHPRQAQGGMLCPAHVGGESWERRPTIELGLIYCLQRGLQLPRNHRTERTSWPGRHRQAARALPRRRRPASSGAPSRRPQGSRSRHRRDQGGSQAHLPELLGRARDRRQPGVHRAPGRHLLGP
jgi:hypothetical protein